MNASRNARLSWLLCALLSALTLRLAAALLATVGWVMALAISWCVSIILGSAPVASGELLVPLAAWCLGAVTTALAPLPLLELAAVIAAGAVIRAALLRRCEHHLLSWSGCRRLSRAEARRIDMLMRRVALSMGGVVAPRLLMSERDVAVASLRRCHLVISPLLLELLDDALLEAVLAHELAHVDRGDPAALALISGLCWPITVLADLRSALLRRRGLMAGLLAALIWPPVMLGTLGLASLVGGQMRRAEYDSDRRAAEAGYGDELRHALLLLADFESAPRLGLASLMAVHPPRALRCEALEPADSDGEPSARV